MEKATVLNRGLSNVLANTFNPEVINNHEALLYQSLEVGMGELIFKEGDLPKGLYYVHSGCVKMLVNRAQSRGRTTSSEYITKIVGPGEFFGYKAIIRKGFSVSSAMAVKPSTLWLYSKQAVEQAIESSSPLIRSLLIQAIDDLEIYETTNQLHYLASVQERIAHQLLILSDKFGVPSEKGTALNLKLTRNEFAQLASTINESLSRHLTEFKNEGLIDINGKEILIKDKDGLMIKSGNFKK